MLESQVGETRISNDTGDCAPVQGLTVGEGFVGDIGEQGSSLASHLKSEFHRRTVSSRSRKALRLDLRTHLFWLCSVDTM